MFHPAFRTVLFCIGTKVQHQKLFLTILSLKTQNKVVGLLLVTITNDSGELSYDGRIET